MIEHGGRSLSGRTSGRRRTGLNNAQETPAIDL